MHTLDRTLRFGVSLTLAAVLLMASSGVATASTTVALWHMDDLGGNGQTMVDSSGTTPPNNGTAANVTVVSGGFSGSAYSFNGANSLVAVPSSATLNPGTSPITLTAHARLTVLPASKHDYDLIRKGVGTTTGGDYKMEILSSGLVLCLFKGASSTLKRKAGLNQPVINDGQWHTISCEFTGTRLVVHVDSLAWGRSGTPGSLSNAAELVVGAKTPSTARVNNDWYNGQLDEVSVTVG